MVLIQGTNNSDDFSFNDNPPTDDTVYLAAGNDRFITGNGKDTVSGGSGDDEILTATGFSNQQPAVIFGEAGNDRLFGLVGEDKLYGGDDRDSAFGRDSSDALFGGNDNDSLYGENGNDRIYGEEGDDFLTGGYGSDTLSGGNGKDFLTGQNETSSSLDSFRNADKDTLFGGGGADVFVLYNVSPNTAAPIISPSPRTIPDRLLYAGGGDADYGIIEDFQSGEDQIWLKGNAGLYELVRFGSNTNIYEDRGDFSEDELIAIVKNSSGLSLDSSDFTFV